MALRFWIWFSFTNVLMFNDHSSIQYTFPEFLLCKWALLQVSEGKLLVFMKSVVFRLETSNDLVTSEENILLMCGSQHTSKTFDFYPCSLFKHWKIIPVTVFYCQLVATLSSQLSFQPRTWLLTCPVAHSQSVSTSYFFSCTPLHPAAMALLLGILQWFPRLDSLALHLSIYLPGLWSF